jgi:hypothetical protein
MQAIIIHCAAVDVRCMVRISVTLSPAEWWLSSFIVQQLMSTIWCQPHSTESCRVMAVIIHCAAADVHYMVHSPIALSDGCHCLLYNSRCLLYGAQSHDTEYCEVMAVFSCYAVIGFICFNVCVHAWLVYCRVDDVQQCCCEWVCRFCELVLCSVGHCVCFWRAAMSCGVKFEWLDSSDPESMEIGFYYNAHFGCSGQSVRVVSAYYWPVRHVPAVAWSKFLWVTQYLGETVVFMTTEL